MSGKGADVTFELPDGEVQAHKNIISARVDVFDKMFSSNMRETITGKVQISDSDVLSFKAFLRFLYSGNLTEPFELESVLNLARKYDLPDLICPCISKLKSELGAMAGRTISFADMIQATTPRLALAKKLNFPSVTYECETALMDRIDLEKFLSGTSSSAAEEVLDNVVKLLVLSHELGGTRLRAKCFEYLRSLPHVLSVDVKARFREVAKDHPDLYMEVIHILNP